jgi:hypothetical protein
MSTTLFRKKNVQNNCTFPSYSDEIGSSTEDSREFSEGYTFSAEDTTSSDDAIASIAKNSPRSNKLFRNKANDDASVVSAQSKSTVMTVLTTIDKALDAVVDIIIPPEKGITRSDTLEEGKIPMKKQPSLVQKIISPRSAYNTTESPKDPSSLKVSPTSSNKFGLTQRGTKHQDERDDSATQTRDTQMRRDDDGFSSDLLREGNEKISNLFDINWMYSKKEDYKETQQQDVTNQDTSISDTSPSSEIKPKRTVSFVRRQGLKRAESPQKDNTALMQKNEKRIWKHNTAVNNSPTKSSTRSILGRKEGSGLNRNKPEDQSETKSSKRSFFRRKKSLESNKAIVEEEEQESGKAKDCADWLMNGLCGNSQVEEQTKQGKRTNNKKKRRWSFRMNRKRKE